MKMPFKECPNCHVCWTNRETFLADADLSLVGYQAQYKQLTAGIFLFVHETSDCGTSLAIEARNFTDLHEGPIFEERHTGTEKCPGLCENSHNLDPCPEKCECAFVRDVLQKVKNWPKKTQGAPLPEA